MKKKQEFKKLPKKAETVVKEYLEKAGYDEITVDIVVSDGENVQIKVLRSGGTFAKVEFDFHEYSFCCGMKEMGNISFIGKEVLPNEKWKILIKKAIKQVIEKNEGKEEDNKEGQKIGFSFTFPMDGQYAPFEEALVDLHFQLVGQFTNINSGNELKHYILL